VSDSPYSPLLPASQTPLEGALVQAGNVPAATDDGIREVGTLYDAEKLKADWLPWLAWSQDAIYWSADADESVRRNILRQSWWLHRIAGTPESYRRVARQANFDVISEIRPPDKLFLSAPLSAAQRNAWLRQFPQLRVYPFRRRGTAVGSHCSRSYLGDNAGAAAWPALTGAAARLGQQRYLFRDGTETPLKLAKVVRTMRDGVSVDAIETRLPGRAGAHTWLGRFARFTASTHAERRVYTTTVETPYDDTSAAIRITTLSPGANPLTAQYEPIAQTQRRDTLVASGVFLSCRRAIGPDVDACRAKTGGRGCGFAAGFTARQDAGLRIFRRLYLHEPNAAPIRRTVASHLDAQRLGMPAYHAQLNVDLRRARTSRAQYAGGSHIGRHTSDLGADARVNHARGALAPLRAARDRVWLRTAIRGPIVATNQLVCSPRLLAGEYDLEVD